MGACRHCGKAAGYFRSAHNECQEQHETAVKKIPEFFTRAFDEAIPYGFVSSQRKLKTDRVFRANRIDVT